MDEEKKHSLPRNPQDHVNNKRVDGTSGPDAFSTARDAKERAT